MSINNALPIQANHYVSTRSLDMCLRNPPILDIKLITSLMPQATQQAELVGKLSERLSDYSIATRANNNLYMDIALVCLISAKILLTSLKLLAIGVVIPVVIIVPVCLVLSIGLVLYEIYLSKCVPAYHDMVCQSLMDCKTFFDQHGEALIQKINAQLQDNENFIERTGTKQSFVDSERVFPEEVELRQLLTELIKGQVLVQHLNALQRDILLSAGKEPSAPSVITA